jgi:hypothetical protein
MTTEYRRPWTRARASVWSNAVKYSLLPGLFAACTSAAGADDKTDYERRAAAAYVTLFQSLDRDSDGRVTLLEAHGDLNFGPRFHDMDTNRDGIVTKEELERYIGQNYKVGLSEAMKAGRR